MTIFEKTFRCLPLRDRRRSLVVLALIVLMALFEVAGVASVMPFLAVLAKPSMIEINPVLNKLYELGGFRDHNAFLVALGVCSFFLLLVSSVVRTVVFYIQNRFVQMQRHNLACQLLDGYIGQPYEFFISRNTGDMSKNILSEVDIFIDKALTPVSNIVSFGTMILIMLSFLIFIDPTTAIVSGSVLGGAYMLIYRISRRALLKGGNTRIKANRERFGVISETFGGIKLMKLLGLEAVYLERYRAPSYTVAREFALSHMWGILPRYAVEAIGMGGIILIALILNARSSTSEAQVGAVLPLLGLYAIAGYRLLPAVQNVYQSLAVLRFATPTIETISNELKMCVSKPTLPDTSTTKLDFSKSLKIEGVSYHYPNAKGTGLQNVSFEVPRGSSIGIIGSTGSGKTTLIDVILGLLCPQEGRIKVDGITISDANRRAWQNNLGYVPQDIYLTDGSIAENIAFGFPREEINLHRVQQCAKIACIHDFVITSSPDGYDTLVGERGIRMSGGQCQRIGIARALYPDPAVIVFDEATSALDNETEAEVMKTIETLAGNKTVIIIAHRLSTVKKCDRIAVLENGELSGYGSWSKLLKSNPHLQKAINLQ